MSTEPTGGEHNAEIVPLRAVPGEVAEPVSGGPPAYADVTAPGERKPILPLWLQSREALRNAAKVRSGQGWHVSMGCACPGMRWRTCPAPCSAPWC
jgi:hypothetical protein